MATPGKNTRILPREVFPELGAVRIRDVEAAELSPILEFVAERKKVLMLRQIALRVREQSAATIAIQVLRLRLDNGPEFLSAALKQWAHQNGVELVPIQPGKPTWNAYIERFNRTFRTEVLDRYVFNTRGEIRRMAED